MAAESLLIARLRELLAEYDAGRATSSEVESAVVREAWQDVIDALVTNGEYLSVQAGLTRRPPRVLRADIEMTGLSLHLRRVERPAH